MVPKSGYGGGGGYLFSPFYERPIMGPKIFFTSTLYLRMGPKGKNYYGEHLYGRMGPKSIFPEKWN